MAFAAKGGTELERTTNVETWLAIGGGIACAAGILLSPRTRPRGTLTALLFVLLVLLTAISIEWSVAPGESWIEANRTLAYFAVFAGAVALGNLGPTAGELVVRGLLLAATAVVAYALASRVWPSELAELEIYARIGQPFGYWNAVGATAALAYPLALWLGARRHGSAAASALAYPAAGLLTVALFLTYSRSATLAALAVIAAWIVFVPLRLRSIALVAVAGMGALPVILWATSKAAFTDDGVDLSVREDVATTFGVMLLAMVAVLYVAGYTFTSSREKVVIPPATRMRIGRVLAGAGVCLALLGVGALAASDRGLRGTLADRWYELRNDQAKMTGGPERLGSAASSRSGYWRQAKNVWEDKPLAGVGAGGFTLAALRFRDSALIARHAHGYPPQTLADLGLIGLGLSLALAFSWLIAALRAVGATARSRVGQLLVIGRRDRVDHDLAPAWTADRVAVTALFLAALAYGIQSSIDWTWFVPGPTVMALLAAGFVAGRGPAPEAAAAPEAAVRPRLSAPRVGLALIAIVSALAASWSIWQPARADRMADRALALSGSGQIDAALDRARDAQDVDPLAVKPLFSEGAVHQRAGRNDEALEVFQRVVAQHPEDPQAWLRLANFHLYELGDEERALAALDQALYLDPMSVSARDSFIEIRTRMRADGLLPPEPELAP